MTRDASYDVVVVGGGFAGAILAKELTLAGKRVLCLASGGGQQGPILAAAGAFLLPEAPRWAAHRVFRDPDSVPLGRCR